MNKYLFCLIFFLGITVYTYGQVVEIVLKDGVKRTERIKASSNSQLFVSGEAIDYSDIESVKFDSEAPSDRRLREKLSIAGVKIFIRDQRLLIDIDHINDEPEKGDKKIILICSDSSDDLLYKRIGQHLSSKGYAIENASRDFLTIKTALRATSKLNYSYFLNVLIVDKKVTITAQWKLNNSILAGTRESGFVDWKFTGDSEGTFSMTVNSIVYNDIIGNLSGFDRLKINYE
jgi:hypothetical protein